MVPKKTQDWNNSQGLRNFDDEICRLKNCNICMQETRIDLFCEISVIKKDEKTWLVANQNCVVYVRARHSLHYTPLGMQVLMMLLVSWKQLKKGETRW